MATISEFCNNPASNLMNKSEEPAQKGVKYAVVVQPQVHQRTSIEVSIEKDIKAARVNRLVKEPFQPDDSNKKPKTEDNVENEILIIEEGTPHKNKGTESAPNLLLSQAPLLSPNILEQISSDLKLSIVKENKPHRMDNLQNMSVECMEESSLPSNAEYAGSSLLNTNPFPAQNSDVLQQASVGAKKRKPVAQDKTGNVKRINTESSMVSNIVLARDSLPGVKQQLQRLQVSKQEAHLKSKVRKKRKIKPLNSLSAKRNKNEACIPTTDPETVIAGKLELSQSNSQSSEVCNRVAELKSDRVNKRKQKLVAMQFSNMVEVKKGGFTNQDLTAGGLTIGHPTSYLLQMQPNPTKRNGSKELYSLAKLPETLNTETDRNEIMCTSGKDPGTANPKRSRTGKVQSFYNDQEIPNREGDQKEVCMLNKNQEIINTNRTNFVCFIKKDSVVSSIDTNRNEPICSVSKDPDTTDCNFKKIEVDCAVSKDSEMANSENKINLAVCATSTILETPNACLSFMHQGTLKCSKRNSQQMSEFKPNDQEKTPADDIQNFEETDTNICANFKDNTACISKASKWHPPSSNLLQVKAASSPTTSTIMEMTSPGPSSSTSAFSVRHVGCESFPLPPLEVDESMIEERREERIRRLKDRLKEQEKALDAIRKTMRPNQ